MDNNIFNDDPFRNGKRSNLNKIENDPRDGPFDGKRRKFPKIKEDQSSYEGEWKDGKRDGFGILFLLNDSFYVGFWKEGKQNGVGKYIKGDAVKYGIWKEGKREKWLDSEDEFANCLDPREEKFVYIFQWSKTQLKRFMELDGNEDDESENYKVFKTANKKEKDNDDEED